MELKELTLDVKTWRCGNYGMPDCAIGCGDTLLYNEATGQSCCLGQFAIQYGYTKEEIEGKYNPCELNKPFGPFVQPSTPTGLPRINTHLSMDCIDINDAPLTSIDYKINKLKSRLAKEGITLKVINYDQSTPYPS